MYYLCVWESVISQNKSVTKCLFCHFWSVYCVLAKKTFFHIKKLYILAPNFCHLKKKKFADLAFFVQYKETVYNKQWSTMPYRTASFKPAIHFNRLWILYLPTPIWEIDSNCLCEDALAMASGSSRVKGRTSLQIYANRGIEMSYLGSAMLLL